MSNISLPLSHISQSLCVVRLVGIFGEVLFWTLRVVLGSEDYDFVTHTAWIKFYSRVLDVSVACSEGVQCEENDAYHDQH